MSPAPTFELLRFEATPVAPAVAVVELTGSFAGLEPVKPRLLVETGGVAREMPALEAGGSPWSATFAVALDALRDERASFSLVPGRGPLIALPAPTDAADDDDRFVRLARTVNDLRHRLSRAEEAAGERDALAAELAAAREQLAAAEARGAEAHDAALTAREEQARAEGEADEAREALARAREEARAEVREEIETAQREAEQARTQLTQAQDRAIAAEDDARAARRDLRDARARIEALVRESRTVRTAAARERVRTATPRGAFGDDAAFHAARLGPDWAEGGAEDEDTAVAEEGAPDAGGQPAARFVPDAGEEAGEDVDEAAPAANQGAAPAAVEADEPGAAAAADTAPLERAVDDTAPLEPAADDDTAPLEPVPGDPATTARLGAVEPAGEEQSRGARPGPGLWRDEEPAESVRILRPRTKAGRLAPLPARDPEPEDGDAEDTSDEDVLPPAAVGARLIQPAEMTPRRRAIAILTNPRVIVGGIFVLLLTALVLIFLGFGPL
ncbi:MAG TPA: hypothetical protein VHF89_18235 [Solirubrobacteraceae bacterium]|nr:hypothetical protein [Solirubrobacteraceae bacterium]